MNHQSTGIIERLLYGVAMGCCLKLAAWGWINPDDSAYFAAGIMMALGALIGWWRGRPSTLLTAASERLPDNSKLVIETSPMASHAEKVEARNLADAASDKVTAKVA